jgi:hypothetical protein
MIYDRYVSISYSPGDDMELEKMGYTFVGSGYDRKGKDVKIYTRYCIDCREWKKCTISNGQEYWGCNDWVRKDR